MKTTVYYICGHMKQLSYLVVSQIDGGRKPIIQIREKCELCKKRS